MTFWRWVYEHNKTLQAITREEADAQTKKRISKYQKTQTTLAKKPKITKPKGSVVAGATGIDLSKQS